MRTSWRTSAGPRRPGWRCAPAASWGMGETWEDRIDMALDLSELGVVSIPLNLLTPIPGTPLEEAAPDGGGGLRSVAIFRLLNPTAWIRMAAGRRRFADGGRNCCSGAGPTRPSPGTCSPPPGPALPGTGPCLPSWAIRYEHGCRGPRKEHTHEPRSDRTPPAGARPTAWP